MIKAIIFDLDELLVNNKPNHLKANIETFREYIGDKIDSYPPADKKYVGRKIDQNIKSRMEDYGIDMNLFDEIYQKRQGLFLKLVEEDCPEMSGVESITNIVDSLKLKKALATSGMRKYVEVCIEKLSLIDYFDIIVTGDDVDKGKPNPEIFLKAAEELGLNPEECLVLEDAENGIAAARKAGAKCIGVHLEGAFQDLSNANMEVTSLNEITEEMIQSL